MKKEELNFEHNPFVQAFCKRAPELEIYFHLFNSKYFRVKLEQYRVYICSKPKFFAHGSAGYCSTDEKRIFIRNGLSKNATLQTLVHEMAHSKLYWIRKTPHGKMFIVELSRLRKLGAPLSLSELDQVKVEPFRLNVRNLRKVIFHALIIESIPRKFVPKYLELEFFLPYSEIKKITDIGKIISAVLGGDAPLLPHHHN